MVGFTVAIALSIVFAPEVYKKFGTLYPMLENFVFLFY